MSVWFRYRDYLQSTGSDEFGYSLGSVVRIALEEFDVVRVTACGVWLSVFGEEKFVRKNARKRFACPTIEEARESFIARKRRQLKIHSSAAQRAAEAAAAMRRLMEGEKQS